MTARNKKKGNVIKFPERMIRPDLARCRRALDEICEDDPERLLLVAFNGVQLVFNRVGLGVPNREQVTVNRLAISFLALAELLGIGAEMEALLLS
jgi:hypothetical protein